MLVLGWAGACVDRGDEPHDHHHDMPEASAPTTQAREVGPVSGGDLLRGRAEVLREGGFEVTAAITLEGPASRVSLWLELAPEAAAPRVEVQAGWSSGQTGPWVPLEGRWAEGRARIAAASLETVATQLRFRWPEGALDAVEAARWAANVPISPELRAREVAPAASLGLGRPRSAWRAEAPRCGAVMGGAQRITLHRLPAAGLAPDLHLRALQAFAQLGLEWCDLLPADLVLAEGVWEGRGGLQGVLQHPSDPGGRAIALVGCEAELPAAQGEALANLLGGLVERGLLTSAEQLEVGEAPGCPDLGGDPWLRAAVDAWLATEPFADPVEPPPPPARVAGRVYDGDSGAGLGGAAVSCDCGVAAQSDPSGAFTLELPAGTHQLTASLAGYHELSRELTVAAGAELLLELALESVEVPSPGISVIDHAFLIRHFGGQDVDPFSFPETQDGLQQYLDAVGVRYFAAWEYAVPNNPQVAAECGYSLLLPGREWWRKAGALGLFADQLRALVNEPVRLRNWWRPPCYNVGVGGAPGGDHPDADALDLDFRSARSRADAQRWLCDQYWRRDIVAPEDIAPGSDLNPRLNLSVGLGGVTIHLGVLSRNGRRYWKYGSYTNESNSGACW